MKLCKDASSTDCGQKICCFECEKKDLCNEKCGFSSNEGCESLYDEDAALQVFNDKATILMKSIANLDRQKKALDEKDKEMRKLLKAAMDEFGIKLFENDILKVTYVAETIKTTVDSKRLKAEQPDIFNKYSKTSPVSASVRISVKG